MDALISDSLKGDLKELKDISFAMDDMGLELWDDSAALLLSALLADDNGGIFAARMNRVIGDYEVMVKRLKWSAPVMEEELLKRLEDLRRP